MTHTPSRASARPLTKSLITLVTALWVIAAPTAAAEETLFLAKYTGKYSGMNITSTRKLVLAENGRFTLYSKLENFLAAISEKSEFTMEGHQIKPASHHYKRKLVGFKADEKITFNWDSGIAEYRRKKKPEKNKDHPITLGILDPALYQLQLQREVQAGKKAFKLIFVKPSKVKTLLFHITGEEVINVGKKEYQGVKVERINLDDLKKTTIWLVPALNHQIARIEHQEEDGESYAIQLSHYESSPKLVEQLYNLPSEKAL